MTTRHRIARTYFLAAGALFVAVAAVASCGETAANRPSGERCSLNSDCKAPLVCGFERCRAECKTSRDCNGRLCVRSDVGGNVCQLDDEVECTHNSQCTGTQLCGPDKHCRDVCITDKDCVTDLLCVSRVCAKREELVDGKLPERSASDAGAHCTYATDCPGTLVCLSGSCDVECLADKDCLVGWSCRPQRFAGGDGRCYPNGSPGCDACTDASSETSLVDGATDGAATDGSSGNDASDAGDAGDGSDGGAPPPTLASFARFAVGISHGCVLLPGAASPKCWGFGVRGQLGYGDSSDRGFDPSQMGDNLPFINLGTGLTARAIFAGGQSSCAILTDGRLKCWGFNNLGQLGLGDAVNRGSAANQMGDALPFVDLGTGRTAKMVSIHSFSMCAVLDNDGVKCWGSNSTAQLGLGDLVSRGNGPNQMGDNLPFVSLGTGRIARNVVLGANAACVLLDNDKVKCWGNPSNGGMGSGDGIIRGDQPGEMGDNLPYVDLGTGRTAKAIAGGNQSFCVILDNDKVKCWGYGGNGCLGYGDAAIRGNAPNQMGDNLPYVDLGPGRTAKAISANGGTSCVLLDNDLLKCWGDNAFGQLGYGDMTTRGDAPGQMGANLPFVDLGTGRTVRAIYASIFVTCAILDNDKVKCFGNNNTGQLGLGDAVNRGGMPNQMGDNLPYLKLFGP